MADLEEGLDEATGHDAAMVGVLEDVVVVEDASVALCIGHEGCMKLA